MLLREAGHDRHWRMRCGGLAKTGGTSALLAATSRISPSATPRSWGHRAGGKEPMRHIFTRSALHCIALHVRASSPVSTCPLYAARPTMYPRPPSGRRPADQTHTPSLKQQSLLSRCVANSRTPPPQRVAGQRRGARRPARTCTPPGPAAPPSAPPATPTAAPAAPRQWRWGGWRAAVG